MMAKNANAEVWIYLKTLLTQFDGSEESRDLILKLLVGPSASLPTLGIQGGQEYSTGHLLELLGEGPKEVLCQLLHNVLRAVL